MSPVSTPCIRVCVIDDASGLCQGCGRSLAEIAAWASLSEPERRAVMAVLPARMARLAPEPPAPYPAKEPVQ